MQERNCCYQCQDRYVGCHSECEKHNKWLANYKKRKAEIRKVKTKEYAERQYIRDAFDRYNKRK